MDNMIGKRLDGRYSIEGLVGVGGMANVSAAPTSRPATRLPSRC